MVEFAIWMSPILAIISIALTVMFFDWKAWRAGTAEQEWEADQEAGKK